MTSGATPGEDAPRAEALRLGDEVDGETLTEEPGAGGVEDVLGAGDETEPDLEPTAEVDVEPELDEPVVPVLAASWAALDEPPLEPTRVVALGSPLTVEALILTAVMTIAFELFLLIEPTPRWLALFAALLGGLGTDGVLRAARRAAFRGLGATDTTPYLFLPTLLALTLPVFAEHNAQGYWAIPIGLGGGLLFGAVVVAEVASVRPEERLHAPARFVAAAATYLVGFALFSMAYLFDLGLWASLIAVAAMAVLLAVELLRDGALDPLETLVFASIVGLVVAQARWVLQFLPIDSYLAGLSLLLVFYFVTGLIHAHMTRHLSVPVVVQYALVSAIGVAMVVGARVAGIA